jgi:hypothetical protein
VPNPGPEHARLEAFIGKWINEGATVPQGDDPAAKILTRVDIDADARARARAGS